MEREIIHIEPKNDLSGQIVDGDKVDIIGAKVIRGGPDWAWDTQGKDSEYGIVVSHMGGNWYNVNWFDKNGTLLDKIHNYRAGKVKEREKYDLLYY